MRTPAERLRWFIDNHCRISQTEFSKRTDIPLSTLSRWLSGQRAPRARGLWRMHEEFGLNTDWLLYGNGSPVSEDRTPQQPEKAQEAPSSEWMEIIRNLLDLLKIKDRYIKELEDRLKNTER